MMESQANAAVIADSPTICAIGASAGCVRALQDFFSAIDDDLGLSYVIVTHLSRDDQSQLNEILGGRTRMSVEQVERSLKLRPNCAYVIAPDRELVIDGDNLAARPVTEPRSKRARTDRFFRSVAAARGDGLAVVLSGTGSDGALGVRAVKEAGSVIFVQDPDEAEYPAMPQSAIATRIVDFIAPVPALVQRIAEVVRSRKAVRQLNEKDAEQGLRKIIHLLLGTTRHDFSHCERTVLMRQVARRMQVSRHDSIGSYVHYLHSKPEEVQALLADLMISVRSFFRERDAFGALARRAIQPIFKELGENAGVRVWIIGCATGEEAYSVALLLLEEAARSNFHGPIQIFASDLDEKAIAVAREGRYPKAIAADVSQKRLRRFFTEDGEHYRIRKEVRDRLLFATHNMLQDPPFIRIDLIICRDILIRLDRELQDQLCAMLHYALKPDGYLFLGSADGADPAPELFRLIDRDARLYRANPMAERAIPVIPQSAPVRRCAIPGHDHPQLTDSEATLANFHLSALERQSPPSVLVDAEYRVLHLSPQAGRFICPSEGPLRTELGELVHPELRLELNLALQRAFEGGKSTLTRPVTVEIEGKRQRIMEYVALTEAEGSAPHALVLFLDVDAAGLLEEEASADAAQAAGTHGLVQELTVLRARLNASEKQHAQALQALAASNEELQSINEEYRSNSEELKTSNEELESANEELKTINAELKTELDNFSSSHNDLQNLIAATEIGALFLDQQLRIKFFTPAVVKHFNITQADCGRAITDFTHGLDYDSIANDATIVLKSLIPMEAEVKTLDDRWLMMRMRPYRAFENLIGGVVLTLTDITELKRTEKSLAAELNAMTRLQQLSTEVVKWPELESPLLLVLDAAIELLGADFGDIQLYDSHSGKLRIAAQRGFDKAFLDHFAEVDASEGSACGIALASRQQVLIGDVEREQSFRPSLEWAKAAGFRAVQSTPLITHGEFVGMLSTHFREPRRFSSHDLRLIDICARQASDSIKAYLLQESLRKSETRMRQVLETDTVGVLFLDPDGTVIGTNNSFLKMTGYSHNEIDARELNWRKMTPPEWLALSQEQFDKLERSGLIGPYEKEHVRKDGSRCWMLFAGRKLDDGTIAEYCIDISDRKRAERERELLAIELSHRVKNTLAVVEALASQTTAKSVKEFRDKFTGRIQALAQAHTLSFESDRGSVDLKALLEQALSAYHIDHAERVVCDGAPIAVTPKQALGLRLMMHELVTNTVKYGALSTKRGTVHLSWQIEQTGEGQHMVQLRWQERGGPAVKAPKQPRFGAKLIKAACEYDLEGEARLDYVPEGLICEIAFPTH